MDNDEQLVKSKKDIHVAKKFIALETSARDRKLDFNLELKDVRKLLNTSKCYYSGVILIKGVIGGERQHTIDRVDNSKGYVKGNVVACSYRFNQLKDNISINEVKQIYKAFKKRGLI